MIIIPAIDIIDGKCVRLSKGDYDNKKIYNEDPVAVAKSFEKAGFERVHVVDLDGARLGRIQNLGVLKSLCNETGLIYDFGGGIKTSENVEQVFEAGAKIITIGSIAVKNARLVEEWVLEFGSDNILVGADVLDNQIKVSGWKEDGGVSIYEFINSMLAIGIKNIFCTDISKDGMMDGVSAELYRELMEKHPAMNLIASGGVTNINDVKLLEQMNCKGVIIGKAIYEGAISLESLIALNSKY